MISCKLDEEKELIYSSRVLVGNWYEANKLEEYKLDTFLEHMRKGDLMLARFRTMTENLNTPAEITQSPTFIDFGNVISLLAPYVPATSPAREDKKGLLLGGRISADEILTSQELRDGCHVVGIPGSEIYERHAFIVTSADYCDRAADNEHLKYSQEFMLTLSSSVRKKRPLYLRYEPNPLPGLNGWFPLYLSEHPVTNCRWRVLPIQRNDITRFEQEGQNVNVNTDVIINHCATNVNLGMSNHWSIGFYGKLCSPEMKTCLNIYGAELPNNIWQFHVPIAK